MIEGTVWIETYTGKQVNPLALKAEDISILDIAHSLSLKCRFGGHCSRFYSVAAHSLGVSQMLDCETRVTKRAALLHDAAEAYLPDVPRPVKLSWSIFRELEEEVMMKITSVFRLAGANWEIVKKADNIMLATEAKFLMASKGDEWQLPEPAKLRQPIVLDPTDKPESFEARFLEKFFSVEFSYYVS